MIEGQEGVSWEQWVALAGACEDAGIEAMFRSDHYLGIGRPGNPGSLDAWATLAALAAVTRRLRLGTLVSPVTFRPAPVLAKNAVTVDHVSGGRVEVGIGAGWFEPEHEVYGFPFGTARDRIGWFREQIETVVEHWTGDERIQPKPVQRPHPPLIVGGAAKRGTVEPAVRYATEYNTTGVGPDECRRRRGVLDEACRAAGRDPASLPLSLMRGGVVAADEPELLERVAQRLEVTGKDPRDARDFLARREADSLVGTIGEVAERLRDYEAAGVTRVMLQHLAHEDVGMVERLGELARAVG